MTDELLPLNAISERQRRVLRVVVEQYVQSAQPVGSSAIVCGSDLGVSPATIRHDLAALEKLGLLTHPHTSAGRVPTDLGYRYFVHQLLAHEPTALALSEQDRIRHQFDAVRQDMEQVLRLSTAVLARTAHGAALATAPRSPHSRFKHMELVHIHATKVLLVLVLQEGTVKQQLLDLETEMTQQELSQLSNELNDRLLGLDADAIPLTSGTLSAFGQEIAELVTQTMQRQDQQSSRAVFRDGLVEVLAEPEFGEGDNVRGIVQVLEEPSLIEQIAEGFADPSTVQVMIAGDGRYRELRDVSLVVTRYGVVDRATGVLGVVGPLRMSYGRSIGAVRFVADLMNEMVEDIYGA